jgi:hypothetical protein
MWITETAGPNMRDSNEWLPKSSFYNVNIDVPVETLYQFHKRHTTLSND